MNQCHEKFYSFFLMVIRNFLSDPDPELEVLDPELDVNLNKNHHKISNLIIFFEKYNLKCYGKILTIISLETVFRYRTYIFRV
jgi:hypothetical protein